MGGRNAPVRRRGSQKRLGARRKNVKGKFKDKDERSLRNNKAEEVRKQAHQNHIETIYFIGSPYISRISEQSHAENTGLFLTALVAPRNTERRKSKVDTGLSPGHFTRNCKEGRKGVHKTKADSREVCDKD